MTEWNKRLGDELWKLQHQTLSTGYDANHREQQKNLNTTVASINQLVLELISEDEAEDDGYGLGKINEIRNILRQQLRDKVEGK